VIPLNPKVCFQTGIMRWYHCQM